MGDEVREHAGMIKGLFLLVFWVSLLVLIGRGCDTLNKVDRLLDIEIRNRLGAENIPSAKETGDAKAAEK